MKQLGYDASFEEAVGILNASIDNEHTFKTIDGKTINYRIHKQDKQWMLKVNQDSEKKMISG